MHIVQMARRNAEAQERILKAACELAEKNNLPDELVEALRVQGNDPPVKALKEREAVANLLEALAGHPAETPAEDLRPAEPADELPAETPVDDDHPAETPAEDAQAPAEEAV